MSDDYKRLSDLVSMSQTLADAQRAAGGILNDASYLTAVEDAKRAAGLVGSYQEVLGIDRATAERAALVAAEASRIAGAPLAGEGLIATASLIADLERLTGAARLEKQTLGAISGLQAQLTFPQVSLEQLTGAAAVSKQISETFAVPGYLELVNSAHGVARAAQEAFESIRLTGGFESLAERMAAIQTSWAFKPDIDLSVASFASLRDMSLRLKATEPYSHKFADLHNQSFGSIDDTLLNAGSIPNVEVREARYSRGGRREALVAFPDTSYPSVLVAAGFWFEPAPLPPLDDDHDVRLVDGSENHPVLTGLEAHLREFIRNLMLQAFGEGWIKSRVPQALRERWISRREEAVSKGMPRFNLICYADFMDICDLIRRADNWRDVFGSFFSNQDDFRVCMRRLHAVRIELAHSRPLSKTEQLSMVVESGRLFRAMGVPSSLS